MSDTEILALPVVTPNVPPSVNLIAAGGGGINMVRAALADISGRATYRYLDTSKANLRAGETAHIIGGGGSGLVRSHNVDAVIRAIANLSDDDLGLADINIVVFSLAGGSGSVIGPLLIGDIANRRKKLVIALTISSTQSEKHTENTLNTLQSLRSITANTKLYLPISIFNNNAGVQNVDRSMPYKIGRLIDLLTAPTVEVDKNDRLHWVNVSKTLDNAPVGLRLLHVKTDGPGPAEDSSTEIWPSGKGYIYDSLLALRTEQYQAVDKPNARVTFEGLFSTMKLNPIYGVIGNPPNAFDVLTKTIGDTLNQYRAQEEAPEETFDFSSAASVHKSGLVL